MFQITASHWWAKASTSLTSNTAFCPPCPSYLPLVISPSIHDMKWSVAVSGKLPAMHTQHYWKRQGTALWIYSELSMSSQHQEPLSVTDSATDAWRLSRIVPDNAQRLWSSMWNKIVLPINFLSYLMFPPAVSFPCWIWPPAHSAVSVWEGASHCYCPACCAA